MKLIKQTILIISFIDKFNFLLIRALNYIQRFNLKIRHKSNKMHVILNALSRLINLNVNAKKSNDENKLNVLFIINLIEMKKIFRNRLLKNYFKNFH